MAKQREKVFHPDHYNQGKMEVIEAIEGLNLGFCEGNALKYMARGPYKDEHITDLEKAIWYLTRRVAVLKLAASLPLTLTEKQAMKLPRNFKVKTKRLKRGPK